MLCAEQQYSRSITHRMPEWCAVLHSTPKVIWEMQFNEHLVPCLVHLKDLPFIQPSRLWRSRSTTPLTTPMKTGTQDHLTLLQIGDSQTTTGRSEWSMSAQEGARSSLAPSRISQTREQRCRHRIRRRARSAPPVLRSSNVEVTLAERVEIKEPDAEGEGA